MKQEGPPIEQLTRRLAACPPDFLAAPRMGGMGKVQVAAVVSDLLRDLGGSPLSPAQAAPFESRQKAVNRNRLSTVLVACWLLHDPWFRQGPGYAQKALEFLSSDAADLAAATSAELFVEDHDRREEMARLCLARLDLRPAGESIAQAEDRLTTLNAAERRRVMLAAQQAEQRSRAIREAMRLKEVEEANLKAMRE